MHGTSFFASFEETEADFLSTTVFRRSSNPSWMHWPTLRVPPSIGLSSTNLIASFMPIYRISRRAAQAIDHAYQSGWSGHCEVTWPTIINRAGFSIEDFGGDGEFLREPNRNRFYYQHVARPESRTRIAGLASRPCLHGTEEREVVAPGEADFGISYGRTPAMSG